MRKYDGIPDKFKGLQRKDVPDIENILMGQAILWSKMSKDPSTQVGAAIISNDNRVLSCGYNGTPVGWPDEEFPWGKNYEGEDKAYEKYAYVIHAEDNAVRNFKKHNKDIDVLNGATIYVTLFPCSHCARIIKEAGIKKVVYLHDYYANTADVMASKNYLKIYGIEFEQFRSKDLESIEISLNKDVDTKINKLNNDNSNDGPQRKRK